MHKVIQVQLEASLRPELHEAIEKVLVDRTSIRRQAHDLAFVAVAGVTDELAHHRVKDAQRVREQHAVENLNACAVADRRQGGGKVAEAVHAENGGAVEVRYEETTGSMAQVVFDIVNVRAQPVRLYPKRFANKLRRLLSLGAVFQALAGHFGYATEMGKREAKLGEKVRLAVLVDADMVDCLDTDARYVEHFLDRLSRETGEMLDAIEPLFSDGSNKL